MVDEQKPSVAEVTSRLRTYEDHNLAIRLQEEEFNRHYNRNRVDRRTVGNDTKRSKDEQAKEDRISKEIRARSNRNIEESDEDFARQLQQEFDEEERQKRVEKEHQTRMDAEMALRIANLGVNLPLETNSESTSSSTGRNHDVSQYQSSSNDLIDLSSPTRQNEQHELPQFNMLYISNNLENQLNSSPHFTDSELVASTTKTNAFVGHTTTANHPLIISADSHSTTNLTNANFPVASTNIKPPKPGFNDTLFGDQSIDFSWPNPPERILYSNLINDNNHPVESNSTTMSRKTVPYELDPTNPFLQDLTVDMQGLTTIPTMPNFVNINSQETRHENPTSTTCPEHQILTSNPSEHYYSEFGLPPPSDIALSRRGADFKHH